MINRFWPKILEEVCIYAYHPGLYSQTPNHITKYFLWDWGNYSVDVWPVWEHIFDQGRDDDERFSQDIFPLLQRAVAEGQEEDRVYALFLLGALAIPETRSMLISFLSSVNRKERWASAISLGRLKEERVFPLLQTLLLQNFRADDIFADTQGLDLAGRACKVYRQTYNEQGRAKLSPAYNNDVLKYLKMIDYEWYLYQRSECAIVLGNWGNPVAVPILQEALQVVWNMEQDWPDYEGLEEEGPDVWYIFQDRLAFALGQLSAWDALLPLRLPEAHLHVARIYLILGYLQIDDLRIFYSENASTLFRDSPAYLQSRVQIENAEVKASPFVEPTRVKSLLAEQFGLSPAEQETYLIRFHDSWYGRAKESQAIRKVQRRRDYEHMGDNDPFLAS